MLDESKLSRNAKNTLARMRAGKHYSSWDTVFPRESILELERAGFVEAVMSRPKSKRNTFQEVNYMLTPDAKAEVSCTSAKTEDQLSKTAKKTLARIRAGKWYRWPQCKDMLSIIELEQAGLIGVMGRCPITVACYVPATGYIPHQPEQYEGTPTVRGMMKYFDQFVEATDVNLSREDFLISVAGRILYMIGKPQDDELIPDPGISD